ncbi:hypothetical protein TNCV_3898291 [Trichonephila clavipes]|nr:hypothetical protein TNCV_3898291 [Trichonephila clavipes]
MPGKHSPNHNAPASSLDRSGNGFRVVPLSEVSRLIRQRPSVRWSIKRDASENATCRHSVDVQLLYWRANSSLRR